MTVEHCPLCTKPEEESLTTFPLPPGLWYNIVVAWNTRITESSQEVVAVGHNNEFGMKRMTEWENICLFLNSLQFCESKTDFPRPLIEHGGE
jgi:hypothetical protein